MSRTKHGVSSVILLGLGSNLGDRDGHLAQALELLSQHVTITRRSSAHQFPALLPEGAPASWDIPFLNMVAAGTTMLPPQELLAFCKHIEATLGRPADHAYWSPRTIDIDILDYDGMELKEQVLTLPHAGIAVREFVLRPLVEILPEWRHPVLGLTARQLLRRQQTRLVGILNITPDSFSDGGKNAAPEAALTHARKLLAEGASIIDIGAESTRPGATPLTPAAEWQRLEPVLQLLRRHLPDAVLSLDTRHPETVRNALPYTIAWVNDVSGFTDPAMVDAILSTDTTLVVMHNLGIPADKEITLPANCDPVAEVAAWLEQKLQSLIRQGISQDRIIMDPGIGFGKTPEQSLALVKRIGELKTLGVSLLVGHSEKSFLSLLTDEPAGKRGVATQRVTTYLAQEGIRFLRVHDVAGNADALISPETITL